MYVTLKRGDRLPTVALAQSLLANDASELAIDGIFGPKTLEAVKAFQQGRGLTPNGWVNRPTWTRLITAKPIRIVDVIDGSSMDVVNADLPHLGSGRSDVLVNYGMSRGTMELIEELVSKYAANSITLLRFHGHGSAGNMGVSGYSRAAAASSVISHAHFDIPMAVQYYRKLGGLLQACGSIEFHGCNVARGPRGRKLMHGMLSACGVPITAGLGNQTGGRTADRFEGPTRTFFPRSLSLKMWSRSVFNQCYP